MFKATMMDCGAKSLVCKANSRTVIPVKLTEELLSFIEERSALNPKGGASLKFDGEKGSLSFAGSVRSFEFIMNSWDNESEHVNMYRETKKNVLEKVGDTGRRVLRIQPSSNRSSFHKVEESLKRSIKTRESQAPVILELGNVHRKRKSPKSDNLLEKYHEKKRRKDTDIETANTTDQGYETEDSPKREKRQNLKESSSDYKLVYTDINTDFLTKYVPVTSVSQRRTYKDHFDIEYPKYQKLHKILEEKCSKLSSHSQVTQDRDLIKKFKYLYEKLRYIKFCVKSFDCQR